MYSIFRWTTLELKLHFLRKRIEWNTDECINFLREMFEKLVTESVARVLLLNITFNLVVLEMEKKMFNFWNVMDAINCVFMYY